LLETFCKERGIELTFCPAEQHEIIGDVERSVGELKKKMAAYLRQEAEASPADAAAEMCGAHSRFARVGGYAPNQWAFGRDVDERGNLALATALKVTQLLRCTTVFKFGFVQKVATESSKPKPRSHEL
jgi:hypothetical protein